ncbi:FAD/NAD(P)-binding protein [Inquilinus limosus]|uniref:FAD/NAD(P)-binding protein n=1 Tax=Inquilinus limosus TaxID=171674 RepID=UPI000421E095|nr:FAD-dependent oxidoreductase [Inquilinus limosus]
MRIAIIGAGFTGCLLAVQLLRRSAGAAKVVLIERGGPPGRGMAYGTPHPAHLLNVRTANMSALPDEPDDFQRWARAHGAGDEPYLPRRFYGDYVGETLAAAGRDFPGGLTVLADGAVGLDRDSAGVTVRLASGRTESADIAALCIGNAPPSAPIPLPAAPGRILVGPEDAGLAEIPPDETVLIIGTGLTMIDIAAGLGAQDHRGRVLALSRRGLLPRPHRDVASKPAALDAAEFVGRPALAVLRRLRALCREAEAAGGDWRAVIDGLRPFTQALWRGWDEAEAGRFLRHLRPWWDVHRHRVAPAIADRVGAMIASGQLQVVAGRLRSVSAAEDGLTVTLRRRGAAAEESRSVGRLVLASGPETDPARTDDPLLRSLLAGGAARPDRLRLGLDVDAEGRLIGHDGQPSPRLFALGPPTRGAFWEITAVPDIRRQCAEAATAMLNGDAVPPPAKRGFDPGI